MGRTTSKSKKKAKLIIRDGVSLFQYMSSNYIFEIELHDNTQGNANGWFTSGNQTGVISQKLTTQLKTDPSAIDLSTLKVGKFDSTDRETGKPSVAHMLYQGGTKSTIGSIKLDGSKLSFL